MTGQIKHQNSVNMTADMIECPLCPEKASLIESLIKKNEALNVLCNDQRRGLDKYKKAVEEIKDVSSQWVKGQNTIVRTGLVIVDEIAGEALK